MGIKSIKTVSSRVYEVDVLSQGAYQYMDRNYQFNYVPAEMSGYTHIKTCGDDKLISEDDDCVVLELNEEMEVNILFADKFPIIPKWLKLFERAQLNVTRFDSSSDNIKGYFSVYKKVFPKGFVTLGGCSPNKMLHQEWYYESMGTNYCMYSICLKPSKESALVDAWGI